ncbi:MAG: porin [Verrucomicrobiales bacterium]
MRGVLIAAMLLQTLFLQAGDLETGLEMSPTPEPSAPYFRYGDKGLQFTSSDQQTDLWLGLRFQSRTDTLPGQIRSASDLQPPPNGATEVKRARIKGGGTLLTENFEIYSEYNIPTNSLLDYRGTWHLTDHISIRAGQWKSDFNRERIDSSGKQQFVDRSLANYWFTLDRQMGTSLRLRLNEGEPLDTDIWLEYLSGRGLGANYDGDSGLWMMRWQWNPQGTELGFSQADLDRTEDFTSAVTLGAVYGDSHYTRFSSSGGGQLPGYTSGEYRLNQLMFETAAKWRGWSWQQELHWKDVERLGAGTHQSIFGGYAQVGTFPSEYFAGAPEPLELVARIAHVTPDVSLSSNDQWEWSLGANWYFNGHRNKISADISALDMDDPAGGESDFRFRLQWDVSF